MKILYVTPEPPGEKSGGQICVKQSLYMLSNAGYQIDYVGPEFKDVEIQKKISKKYVIKESNKFITIINIFRGGTSKLYYSLMKKLKNINLKEYDYLYMEFSKWDFMMKIANKNNLRSIVHMHNIESDYFKKIYGNTNKKIDFIKWKLIRLKEKKVIYGANKILVLTEKDKMRLEKLYEQNVDGKINIVPICVEECKNENYLNKDTNKEFTILTTGSLWYGPNNEGIKWFIENVYPYLNDIKFVVAGSNPTTELKRLINNFENIKLIENPSDMEKYFSDADLYIAPIFFGAGMKVKIAQALSYGLPIVGSEHAFIGYNILNSSCCFKAKDKTEFIEYINKIKDEYNKNIYNMHNEAYELYINSYSLENCQQYLTDINI